jgi:hypothetical protein
MAISTKSSNAPESIQIDFETTLMMTAATAKTVRKKY